MKIKDKKILFLILMINMVIGIAILVYNPMSSVLRKPGDKETAAAANLEKKTLFAKQEKKDSDTVTLMSVSPTPTPSPTPIPTPTPLPVYPLEEKGYPSEIDTLVETYYEAKSSCDIDTLKSISSEPSNVISKKQLLQLVEGIDEYDNIKCYVKKAYEEGAYIVFVYYDIKFIGLNTLAPSLSKLYIITDRTGTLKIYDGEISEELKEYLNARSEDEDVLVLRDHTNQLAEKAKEKDKDLKAFWEILDNY